MYTCACTVKVVTALTWSPMTWRHQYCKCEVCVCVGDWGRRDRDSAPACPSWSCVPLAPALHTLDPTSTVKSSQWLHQLWLALEQRKSFIPAAEALTGRVGGVQVSVWMAANRLSGSGVALESQLNDDDSLSRWATAWRRFNPPLWHQEGADDDDDDVDWHGWCPIKPPNATTTAMVHWDASAKLINYCLIQIHKNLSVCVFWYSNDFLFLAT